MRKISLNLVIDLLLFLCLSAIAGIGFLIKYILIIGQETIVKYGENIQLEFFGMDRHEWGEVHLVVGVIVLILIVLHLVFHWQLVKSMIKKVFGKSALNTGIVIAFVLICVLFIFAPFLVNPDMTKKERKGRHQQFENKKHGKKKNKCNFIRSE